MKIIVGSINPSKIEAVSRVASRVFVNFEIIPIDVESEVSHTPISEDEIIHGAINRALNASRITYGDLYIGMEGGIVKKFDFWFVTSWCAILDSNGIWSFGCGGYMPLPNRIVEMVLSGLELGDAIDRVSGLLGTKLNIGAIGVLTKNLLTRRDSWEIALIYALTYKISPEFYL
ncbi:MAG: inosine/xanthosine triphosphatase [Candidatus Methanomethylicia archaeon]|nr:inosine/xanthosine triphosphatase [Candidatus Methanomethylicia archaeon]